MGKERQDAMILTNYDTFYKGWVEIECDGQLRIYVDQALHPYLTQKQTIPIRDVLILYKKEIK